MNQKDKLLIDLIEQKKSLILNEQSYHRYTMLFDKLKDVIVDFKNISKILESEIQLFQNPDAVKYIAGIEYFSRSDDIEKAELINAVNELEKMLSVAMEKDEDIKKLKDKEAEYDTLLEQINNHQIDEELMFTFIQECYGNGLIDIADAVGLNLYVAKISSVTKTEDKVEEIILVKNVDSILEDLRRVFSKYGYDYDNMFLNKKIRIKLENYARVDYVDYVLSILKDNNITGEDFEDRQLSICDIIVYRDRETLDGINKFVKDNNCTLMDLLGMSAIFRKRKRRFKFKDKNSSGGNPKDGEVIPGDYDSFMKNVALYKKCNNFSDDYKMSKIDFENRTVFFMTPHEKVLENLSILVSYGIVEDGKIPNAISALCGANVQYLLDRSIEAGLFDYCRKNPSFLELDSKEFRWYKIKRSNDLGHGLFRGKGLRKELKNDSEFYGIKFTTKESSIVIEQSPMTMEEMVHGNKEVPDYLMKKMANVFNIEEKKFNLLYRYNTYGVFDLFRGTDFDFSKLSFIKTILSKKTSGNLDFFNESEDEYIKLLDNAVLYDQNNNFYDCKVDDRTYQFINSVYPGIRVVISRYKVLQLVGKLKEDNLWINDNLKEIDKENLLLSVLLKDTIISEVEMQVVRFTVRNILNGQMSKIVSERRGNGR